MEQGNVLSPFLKDAPQCSSDMRACPTGTPKKSNATKGAPDTGEVLCCEVCGKYGLRQDFSASGRFCGLSCVGVYTGRRNKGREFVRKVKTADGKIVKKKKKGKGKKLGMTEKPAGTTSVSRNLQSSSYVKHSR